MARSIRPLGTAYVVAAGAQQVAIPTRDMSQRGIIGLILAISGVGNDLTDIARLRMKVNSKNKFDVPIAHWRRIITRWSDSNLVPADADTIISVPFNLGPAGRLDDRFQLAAGDSAFELVTAATWAAGNFRVYEVLSDEAPIAYTEALNEDLNFAAGAGGPTQYVGAKDGAAFGYVMNTTGLDTLEVKEGARLRHHFTTGAPSPLLEVERMEDGAAAAGLDPRAFVLRGPAVAAELAFNITRAAAWAAAGSLTLLRHVA